MDISKIIKQLLGMLDNKGLNGKIENIPALDKKEIRNENK